MTANRPKTISLDLLACKHIKPELLALERALGRSCWWEYRGEHPTWKTMLFAAEYVAQTRRFTEKYVNHEKADKVSGLTGDGDPYRIFPNVRDSEKIVAKKKRNLVGLWKARQAADELTLSYRLYIAACMERAAMTGWERIPRPTHLYSDKMKMAGLDAQVHELTAYIPAFENPTLLAGSKAPYKREFDEWLYEVGRLRSRNHDLVFGDMVRKGLITKDQAAVWEVLAQTA